MVREDRPRSLSPPPGRTGQTERKRNYQKEGERKRNGQTQTKASLARLFCALILLEVQCIPRALKGNLQLNKIQYRDILS